MKLSIRKKLFFSFLLIIVLYSVMLAVAFNNIQKVRALGKEIVPLNKEAMALQKLNKYLGEFEKDLDQFLVVQNVESQDSARAALNDMIAAGNELKTSHGNVHGDEQSLSEAIDNLNSEFGSFQIIDTRVTISNDKMIGIYKNVKSIGTLGNSLLDENSKEVNEIVDAQGALIDSTSNQFMIFGLTTSVLAVALGIFLGQKISGPIVKLTNSGNIIADGKLDEELPTFKTGDEIESLSNTMNLLVGAIKFLKQGEAKPEEPKKVEKKIEVKKK